MPLIVEPKVPSSTYLHGANVRVVDTTEIDNTKQALEELHQQQPELASDLVKWSNGDASLITPEKLDELANKGFLNQAGALPMTTARIVRAAAVVDSSGDLVGVREPRDTAR
jgi:hypothetical protein